MPALTTAEHAAVKTEQRRRRNAGARRGRAALAYAHAWVETMGARVETLLTPTRVLYTVSVPGFHSQTAWRLVDAVAMLDATIADWCDSPAVRGPTGARLERLREARAAWRERWEEARHGD